MYFLFCLISFLKKKVYKDIENIWRELFRNGSLRHWLRSFDTGRELAMLLECL